MSRDGVSNSDDLMVPYRGLCIRSRRLDAPFMLHDFGWRANDSPRMVVAGTLHFCAEKDISRYWSHADVNVTTGSLPYQQISPLASRDCCLEWAFVAPPIPMNRAGFVAHVGRKPQTNLDMFTSAQTS